MKNKFKGHIYIKTDYISNKILPFFLPEKLPKMTQKEVLMINLLFSILQHFQLF